MKKAITVDEYLALQDNAIRNKLERMRSVIREAAPEAEEVISYGMPAYRQNGILVYFSGCKNHIGFYPTASGIRNFEKDISVYHFSKGAIQFPYNNKLPEALISRIVKFRVKENAKKHRIG